MVSPEEYPLNRGGLSQIVDQAFNVWVLLAMPFWLSIS